MKARLPTAFIHESRSELRATRSSVTPSCRLPHLFSTYFALELFVYFTRQVQCHAGVDQGITYQPCRATQFLFACIRIYWCVYTYKLVRVYAYTNINYYSCTYTGWCRRAPPSRPAAACPTCSPRTSPYAATELLFACTRIYRCVYTYVLVRVYVYKNIYYHSCTYTKWGRRGGVRGLLRHAELPLPPLVLHILRPE